MSKPTESPPRAIRARALSNSAELQHPMNMSSILAGRARSSTLTRLPMAEQQQLPPQPPVMQSLLRFGSPLTRPRLFRNEHYTGPRNPPTLTITPPQLPTTPKTSDDINLIREVTSESLPLSIPKVQTPLLTPRPVPNTKAAFILAIKAEQSRVDRTRAGLERYLSVIHSGEHTVFSPTFLANQTTSTNTAIEELEKSKEALDQILTDAYAIGTPITITHLQNNNPTSHNNNDTPSEPNENLTIPNGEDYFTSTHPVDESLKEKFNTLQQILLRVRGIVIASHCFYKVNYALAADKRKDGK